MFKLTINIVSRLICRRMHKHSMKLWAVSLNVKNKFRFKAEVEVLSLYLKITKQRAKKTDVKPLYGVLLMLNLNQKVLKMSILCLILPL